jgi:hypothetical protein
MRQGMKRRNYPMISTIWDVSQGFTTGTDKARDADAAEIEFYLRWIARTRGIALPADARFWPKGVTVNGVTVLAMPGYGQDTAVTCEILDDAGEVVRTMPLPVSAKGKLPMDAKQVKEWTGLATVRKARKVAAKVDTTPVAVSTSVDPVDETPISAPLSVETVSPATSAPENDAVALLAARLAAVEAILAGRAPAAIPAPANDDTVRPVRSERERAAIVRAWRMRCEMRERADLDRRALEAANGAYRGALDQYAAARASEDAMRAERDAIAEQAANARRVATDYKRDGEAAERRCTALRAQLRDAGRRADRLVMIASGKRRAAATAEAARDRAIADLRGAEAERRAVASRFAKLEAAVDASPSAAAVVSRKLQALAA